MPPFALAACRRRGFGGRQRRPLQGNPASDRMLRGPGCNRHSRVCVDTSVPFAELPRRFHSNGHRDAFSRHDGIYRSDVVQNQTHKPNPGNGILPPPVGRPRAPGKRTRREDHALLIVRDEFRPAIPRSGWSPPEPVSASPTRPE
jgi:hypothetical protein